MSALNGTRTPSGYGADIAPVAALMADPARATMLGALLSGHPLAAGELSQIAGVSPATASAHLGKLLDGGMVAVTRQVPRLVTASDVPVTTQPRAVPGVAVKVTAPVPDPPVVVSASAVPR